MLWDYGHYKYFYSYSAGIDFRRQNLTSTVDPRTVRVKALSQNNFTHLKLCLATATHTFKWMKSTHVLFDLRLNICKSWCLNTNFIPNGSDVIRY